MASGRKRKASAQEIQADRKPKYKNDWERFVEEIRACPHMPLWKLLRYEPFMELPGTLLLRLNDIGINKAFFVCTDAAVAELHKAIAAYIVGREILRKFDAAARSEQLEALARTLGNPSYARTFDLRTLLAKMQTVRITNIDNFYDRGSFRMRYILGGLLCLAALQTHQPASAPLTGAALSKAAVYSVITGGPAICQLICHRLQVPWRFCFVVALIYF